MDNTMAPPRFTTSTQKASVAVGATFLLVGVLGFVPGVTTHYDEMTFAGHHSGAQLLGLFGVSVLHNLVHLAFGVAGRVQGAPLLPPPMLQRMVQAGLLGRKSGRGFYTYA